MATASTARFLLPSLAGAAIFLLPVPTETGVTIAFSIVTDLITAAIAAFHAEALLAVFFVGALGSVLARLGALPTPPGSLRARLFDIHPVWLALRLIGALLGACVFFELGPQWLRGGTTGGTVYRDICMSVLVIYIASAAFMRLLTDYGLLEFVGVLLERPFARAFRLPGRAAVDSLASFVSAAGVGLLITIRQYEIGRYTAREAAVICCSFSVVSLPFALLIAKVSGLEDAFLSWYATIIVACILAALVVARVGPIAAKPETRAVAVADDVATRADGALLSRAFEAARLRAAEGPSLAPYLRGAFDDTLDFSLGLLAPIMAIATIASIFVFETPIFDWLTLPIAWVLEAFGAEASAAKGFVVGVLDQFMPALVAADLDPDARFMRFLLAGLSVSQLVYLSEYGTILLRSPLPITLVDLLVTFALRTVVVTPVLIAGALLLS